MYWQLSDYWRLIFEYVCVCVCEGEGGDSLVARW